MSLYAGFGKCEISPPPESGGEMDLRILSFWYDRAGKYSAVRDGLFARAAVFRSQGETACLVALDLIGDAVGLTARVRGRIQQTLKLPPERVMVACTHTHTSPETIGLTGHPVDERWLEHVSEGAAKATERATAKMAECRLALTSAALAGVAFNRAEVWEKQGMKLMPETERNRYSMLDETLGVAALCRGDGSVQGALFNFACHPVCVQAQSFISADWPGAALARLEADHDSLFVNGACGDADPVRMGHYENAQWVGEKVARKVAELLRDPGRMPSVDNVSIRTARRTFALARRDIPHADDLEREAVTLEAELAGTPEVDPKSAAAGRLFDVREELALARLPKTLEAEVQVLRIGELFLVGIPGELAACLGEDIRRALGQQHCWIVGYANGYLGYCVPRASYEVGGYETLAARWSPLAPGEAERLRDEAVSLAMSLVERQGESQDN